MTVERLREHAPNLTARTAWLPRSPAKNLIDAFPDFRKLSIAA